jgi:hypothetical protein
MRPPRFKNGHAKNQHVLGLIVRDIRAKGGTAFYNNNVDLLAKLGDGCSSRPRA